MQARLWGLIQAVGVFLIWPIPMGYSQANIAQCPDRVIYYINGILNTPRAAKISASMLRRAYKAEHPDDTNIPLVQHYHNPSGGALSDIAEAFSQRTGLTIARAIRMFKGLEPVPVGFQPSYVEALSQAAIDSTVTHPEVSNAILSDVSKLIRKGARVVVVGHSQGNLFANVLMVGLNGREREAVAQVGVAVPASRLEHAYAAHVTLAEDLVISLIPLTLSPTTSNGYSLAEIFLEGRSAGHSFDFAYLDDKRPSNTAVIRAIDQTFERLTKFQDAPDACHAIKITHASCVRIDEFSDRWTIQGTAQSATPLAVPLGLPNPSLAALPRRASFCSDWTGTVADVFFEYCARNPNDPLTTTWSVIWDAPRDTNTIYADLYLGQEEMPHDPIRLAPRDQKTQLTCPGTFTFQ